MRRRRKPWSIRIDHLDAAGSFGPFRATAVRPFREWSLDHQDWQTDYAAQKGQGDISLHSDEHLTACDRGTAMSRRLFRQQAQKVANGEDPIGVGFDMPYRVEMLAGNALPDPPTGECIDGFAART